MMCRAALGLSLFSLTLAHSVAAQGSDARAVRAELAAVLLQSRRYDEAVREYRFILARDPGSVPARLGLARALAWGERPREAERELLMLRARRPNDAEIDALLRSVRESIEPSSEEAARWLAERPGNLPYRRALARALARERKDQAALGQYDTLVAWYPAPEVFLERAHLHAARRDLAAAEADVNASINAGQNSGAYLLLGDLKRWRGDFVGARAAYDRARLLRPDDRAVAVAYAQLARDQRPIPGFMPSWDYTPGWQLHSSSLSDNTGIAYLTAGGRRAVALLHGITGSVDLELRRMAEPTAGADDGVAGFALELGLGREFVYGPFLARVSGRGGVVYHDAGSMLSGAITAAGWLDAWGLAVEHATAPAYPSLLTASSIRSPDLVGEPLTERTTTVTVGGPLGGADIAVSFHSADISDDNRRTRLQALVRYPLTPHLVALYSGTGIWFAERSPLYWDPSSYLASLAGLELATRKPRGFAFAARILAGGARSVEQVHQVAPQVVGGADLSYRMEAQEVGAAAAYGSGRAGDYRHLGLNLYVRLLH